MVEKSTLWKRVKQLEIPGANPKSPTWLTSIAFIATLSARSHVNQKWINKYEARPTPSHPRNNWRELSPITNIGIKKVRMDK